MKKLFLILLLSPVLTGFGQSANTPSAGCNECLDHLFTSISQLTDVKETDDCFVHLQSLVERYGITVAACNKTTFGGSQILSNGALAKMLSSGLEKINELKMFAVSGKSEADKKKIEAKIKLSGFGLFKHQYTTVGKIKDLKASDCYYQAVKILLEDFKIDITNKAGLLQAGKPANGKNVGLLLKEVLGLTDLDVSKYATATITKAEFSILLNMALDQYNEMLGAATY